MEQYDTHMKNILPSPQLLPLRVDIRLHKKTELDDDIMIEIGNIFQIKGYETVGNLIERVKEYFEDKKGDALQMVDLDLIKVAGPLYIQEDSQADNTPGQIGEKSVVGLDKCIKIYDTTLCFQEIGVTA